ncbi:M42 family metallopeptidase [Planctomycetales bacterium ZRK34]|nr:M42 family metallopeptidase [Planctomycetales bacterium ZRK34]
MKLLEKLTQTPSVPGREDRIRAVIEAHVKKAKLFDSLKTDAMGNLIGVRKPRPARGKAKRNPTKVMLAAHMDQIGFFVSYIDAEAGFLRVNPVGGFDRRNLFARRVRVCAAGGDLLGVMNPGGKPVHLASAEERTKVPEMSEFVLDLGLSGKTVADKIKIGDMVVLDGPFSEVGDTVVSQCLDNRIGCWAVIRAIEKLKHHDCEIHAVWTVQEEVGLRGAGPAAFGVEPDIGLSCDTTLNCQVPGVGPELHITKFDEGVCIKINDGSTIADLRLIEELEAIAAKKKIKCQRGILPAGGQDGAMIQRSRSGVRTAVFACPVRYIHTVTEMAHKKDLVSYRDLLAAYLTQLK